MLTIPAQVVVRAAVMKSIPQPEELQVGEDSTFVRNVIAAGFRAVQQLGQCGRPGDAASSDCICRLPSGCSPHSGGEARRLRSHRDAVALEPEAAQAVTASLRLTIQVHTEEELTAYSHGSSVVDEPGKRRAAGGGGGGGGGVVSRGRLTTSRRYTATPRSRPGRQQPSQPQPPQKAGLMGLLGRRV